jgi:hypothetical protein
MISRLRFEDFRATYCSIILICLILLIIVGCETCLRWRCALHFSAPGGERFLLVAVRCALASLMKDKRTSR